MKLARCLTLSQFPETFLTNPSKLTDAKFLLWSQKLWCKPCFDLSWFSSISRQFHAFFLNVIKILLLKIGVRTKVSKQQNPIEQLSWCVVLNQLFIDTKWDCVHKNTLACTYLNNRKTYLQVGQRFNVKRRTWVEGVVFLIIEQLDTDSLNCGVNWYSVYCGFIICIMMSRITSGLWQFSTKID
jgi:hypothetical protein